MRPKNCYYEAIYIVFISLTKATSLMWPQFLGKQGGLIRRGLLYSSRNPWLSLMAQPLQASLLGPWLAGWANTIAMIAACYTNLGGPYYLVKCKEVYCKTCLLNNGS